MSAPIESHCPKCGALPGQVCTGKYGRERRLFHRGRGSSRAFAVAYSPHEHRVESPIEDDMVGAIVAWIQHHDVTDAVVETQVPLGVYTLDIVVTSAGRKLVVECDGVAFHSDLSAIEHDKRRDRFCVIQGYAVMRFTGQEIKRNPRVCASEVGLWVRAQR